MCDNLHLTSKVDNIESENMKKKLYKRENYLSRIRPFYHENDLIKVEREYRTEEGTFWVLDEDESRQATYDDIENTMDDLGLESFTEEFRDWIIEHALDDEWFETACEESERSYAEDIQEEPDRQENGKYANRLVQECVENDLISDKDIVNGEYTGKEDLVELLTECIVENIRRDYSSFCEWYQKNLGGVDYLIKHDIISVDMDAIVDKCIDINRKNR